MSDIRKIAVVTSGGDASGMNASVRSVVRMATRDGLEIVGINRGYTGLVYNDVVPLDRTSVSGIINLGGTILRSSRCQEIRTEEGVERAKDTLEYNSIDGLIVIGGDGSFRGAHEIRRRSGVPIIGIPASIDNDIYGVDETIGFDSAVNVATRAIDSLRDTAYSHERMFIVEVMGRERGFIALSVGISCGAEYVLVPEIKEDLQKISNELKDSEKRGKRSNIIVIAEGYGNTAEIARYLQSNTGLETRVSTIGYLQRGGSPSARSRMLATSYGSRAIQELLNGEMETVVGLQAGEIKTEPLSSVALRRKELDMKLYELAKELSY